MNNAVIVDARRNWVRLGWRAGNPWRTGIGASPARRTAHLAPSPANLPSLATIAAANAIHAARRQAAMLERRDARRPYSPDPPIAQLARWIAALNLSVAALSFSIAAPTSSIAEQPLSVAERNPMANGRAYGRRQGLSRPSGNRTI